MINCAQKRRFFPRRWQKWLQTGLTCHGQQILWRWCILPHLVVYHVSIVVEHPLCPLQVYVLLGPKIMGLHSTMLEYVTMQFMNKVLNRFIITLLCNAIYIS